MIEIKGRIIGEPFAWSAPTFGGVNPKTGKRQTYQSTELKRWQSEIRSQIHALTANPLSPGYVMLIISVYITRPRTVKDEFPGKKPDLDNLVKGFVDGIRNNKAYTGIIDDDNRIIDTISAKRWAHQRDSFIGPGVDFTLRVHPSNKEIKTYG
jgi:Holliday junction resolvase RusA-like endonuclease